MHSMEEDRFSDWMGRGLIVLVPLVFATAFWLIFA